MRELFAQLESATLSDRIALLIEEAILNGSIKPGERVNTDALARQFKVSHIPVREALKQLEVVGLIHTEPNRGARVVELSEDDVDHIFLIRKALKGLAASLAAARITRTGKMQLQALVDQMSSAAKSKDFIKMFQADVRFHQTIWELAGNPFLVKSLTNLLLPYFGYVATKGYYRHRANLSYVPKVHQEVLDAITGGDSQLAQQVIVDVHNRSIQLRLKERAKSTRT